MASIRPNDGDYVVINSQWSYKRYEVRKILKLTSQMYFYQDGKEESRARLDEVLFSSPDEGNCKLLSERLKSAEAQYDEDVRRARVRWELKRESFISNAYAADALNAAVGSPSHPSKSENL
jgi:hypothetical protein